MDVSKLHLQDIDDVPSDVHWDGHDHDGPGSVTATTTTIMPALLDSLALDATLPMDPSFVDIAHPGDQFPRVPPKDAQHDKRKPSLTSESAAATTTTTSSSSSSSSSTTISKQRSVSSPTPATSSATHAHPQPSSSSKPRQRHRSTSKSHQPVHIDDDLLLDLIKEFRAAKKREGAAGSVTMSLGVKSLLSHGSHAGHPATSSLSTSGVDHRDAQKPKTPEPKKKRERSASTASASVPYTHTKSTASTSDSIVLLVNKLQIESARANAAEAQVHEVLERLKMVMKEKIEMEALLARVREELGLYKVQLGAAQREILRAQDIVDSVERQRVLAEKEALRNRERLRRVVEERLVHEALEEGRREGFEEGVRRGREAQEDERRRLAALQEQRERREREDRRQREREREEREKERQAKALQEQQKSGRPRSRTLGTIERELRPVPPPRPPTAGPSSNWPPIPPPRPPTAGPSSAWPTVAPPPPPKEAQMQQPQSRPSGPPSWPAPPPARSQTPPSRSHYAGPSSTGAREMHVPDTGRFAHLLPRPTITTPVHVHVPATQPQPAPAPASMHPQHHHHPHASSSRHDYQEKERKVSSSSSGSSGSGSGRAPPRPDPIQILPSTMSSSIQGPSTRDQARDPHFEKVGHPMYVPPPDNYIPVAGKDGVVSMPPPHELGKRAFGSASASGEDEGGRGRSGSVGGSGVPLTSRARSNSRVRGDATPRARTPSVSHHQPYDGPGHPHGYDNQGHYRPQYDAPNPERERERERLRVGGDAETPTPIKPDSLPEGHVMTGYQGTGGSGSGSGSGKGKGRSKGRMHVVNLSNEDINNGIGARPGSRAGAVSNSTSGWNGIERPKTAEPLAHALPHPIPPRSRLRGVSLSESQRDVSMDSPVESVVGGTPTSSVFMPHVPMPTPPGWDSLTAPSRFGNGAGPENPARRMPLVRSMTSGTTPEIGVEPPSHSPSSAGDNTGPINPGLLTPNLVIPAPNSTPRSFEEPEYDDHNQDRWHIPTKQHQPQPPQPYYAKPQSPHDAANTNHVHVGYYAAPNYTMNGGWAQDTDHKRFTFNHPQGSSTPTSSLNHFTSPRSVTDSNKTDEWAPPPPVALSPIPAITNLDGKLKHDGSSPSPGLGKDSEYVYGRPDVGQGGGKYFSPAPLMRPISLFEDSE